MPAHASIYAPTPGLPSPASVRALAPGAKVFAASEGGADKNPRFVIEWPDLKLLINQMPAGKLAPHLEGFKGYVLQVCATRTPDLVQRIEGMKQCLGILIEPGFDDADRAETLILGLTGELKGLCFSGGSVYAPDGERLASPPEPAGDGDEDEDTPAQDEAASENAEPPPAERVARRALVLGAMAARVSLEGDTGADREERRRWLVGRMGALGLERELEKQERDVLATRVGELARKSTIELSWRSEGLAVLAWALGLRELPPYDRLAETWELLLQELKLLTAEAPPVLAAPRLRAPEELQRMERRLFLLNWRLREFSMRPQAMNLREFAPTARFGPFELEGLALADDDLAIDGVPLVRAEKERVWESQSIALERHRAINWLLGRHRLYSRVDTAT